MTAIITPKRELEEKTRLEENLKGSYEKKYLSASDMAGGFNISSVLA